MKTFSKTAIISWTVFAFFGSAERRAWLQTLSIDLNETGTFVLKNENNWIEKKCKKELTSHLAQCIFKWFEIKHFETPTHKRRGSRDSNTENNVVRYAHAAE